MKTGKVEPYVGLLLGAGFINKNPTGNDPSITKFALGLRLGATSG
jgi:hypothetical protein